MVFNAGDNGKCPHCGIVNKFESVQIKKNSDYILDVGALKIYIGPKNRSYKNLSFCKCASCGEVIISFDEQMIYPWGATRGNAPHEVPSDIAQDFNEACLVESLSKKASAALARRCLQHMLHERGIRDKDLNKEIDIAMKTLPSHLSESIDAIRNIGNFSAHPMKYQNTGDIVDVEEGETERILDTLENLFDFYYVQPAITQAKKVALNAKLAAVGKPAMK